MSHIDKDGRTCTVTCLTIARFQALPTSPIAYPNSVHIGRYPSTIFESINVSILSAKMATNPPPPAETAEQAPAAPSNEQQQQQQQQQAQQPEDDSGYAPLVDPRLPTQKDTSLKDFLNKMDDYAPIVCSSCRGAL